MKNIVLFFLLGAAIFSGAHANEVRHELPIGTTFSIKHDFWLYEIQGRLPYGKETLYVMNSSRGGGIGGDKYKYVATLPAGTRLELVNLFKKNRRKYIYVIKISDPSPRLVEGSTIAIFHLSMLKEPLRGSLTKTIRLDPDLFTDFNYPEK